MSRLRQVSFNEQEAAVQLGLSVQEFRLLVQTHILQGRDTPAPNATYGPADLLALRFLLQSPAHA